MIRSLNDILPQKTSHGVGSKRVLIASNETGCSLTQIAVTELRQGETATAHIHPDMQEAFYVLSGELEVSLDGEKHRCKADDFVYVDCCISHEMYALTDVRIMTIGCVIEATRNKLYPMLFKQQRKVLVWGTEDWTVSAVPGSESEIENGTWARYSLTDVISRHPVEILGRQVAARYGNQLPLLTKIIDAHNDLSIQVHPGDDMAWRLHGKSGKSEMWYVLDAKPGAYLYAGFREQISSEEYRRRVADGSITEVLARHEVHQGDVFYLPAGRVHAICGGIRLAEIQQSSDVTYRIYDYNRPGLDGRPRPLQTDLAALAIDFKVYPEYRTTSEQEHQVGELLNTPYFSINVVNDTVPIHRNMIKYDSFVILMNFAADCKIRIRSNGSEVLLPHDQSCLIPAVMADYDILPADGGEIKVLETFINNRKSISQYISDFLHLR